MNVLVSISCPLTLTINAVFMAHEQNTGLDHAELSVAMLTDGPGEVHMPWYDIHVAYSYTWDYHGIVIPHSWWLYRPWQSTNPIRELHLVPSISMVHDWIPGQSHTQGAIPYSYNFWPHTCMIKNCHSYWALALNWGILPEILPHMFGVSWPL